MKFQQRQVADLRAQQNFDQLAAALPSQWPTVPQARAYNSAAISILGTTAQALTFDSERWDLGTNPEQHSLTANTGRLTCQAPGLYAITAHVAFAANATGSRYVTIRLNGVTTIARETKAPVSAGDATEFVVATLYRLVVGDYVEVLCSQGSGGALNVSASLNFSPEFAWTWVGA